MAKIYSANYFLNEREGVGEGEVDRLKRQTAKLYIDLIVRANSGPTGKVLEIGCGTGDLLVEAQARGFEVSGIETSEYAAARANSRLGAEVVRQGEIETVPVPAEGTRYGYVLRCYRTRTRSEDFPEYWCTVVSGRVVSSSL